MENLQKKVFWRPKLGIIWFALILGIFLGIQGIGLLIRGEVFWGVNGIIALIVGIYRFYWEKFVPIVTITEYELKICRNSINFPKRIPISLISKVDEPSPPKIRIVQKDGSFFILPKHWLNWEDRNEFVKIMNLILQNQ